MGIQMLSFPAGPTGTRGSGPLSGVKGVCHLSYCDAGRRSNGILERPGPLHYSSFVNPGHTNDQHSGTLADSCISGI